MSSTPLQYSCLENPTDGVAWWAAVHGVAKSWTRLSDFAFTFHFHALEKDMATHSSVLAWRIPVRQASLSITNSQSSPKLMSIESVIPSSHLILCRPLLLLPSIFPSIRVFKMSQFFISGGQSIGVSASTSFPPMNTQD